MRLALSAVALLVLAFLGWGGWWWVGSTAKARAVESWLEDRRADGWAADAAISVAGFPNRFDMTVEDLTLADPEAGWAWSAPVFRTFMLAYEPNRVIAEWPGVHRISVPGERAEAEAGVFRASAAFLPTTALELRRGVIEAEAFEIRGEAGWRAGIERATLAARRSEVAPEAPNAYDLAFDARAVAPPDALAAPLSRALGAALPAKLNRLSIDSTVVFRRPVDRRAVEASDFSPASIALRRSLIRWGPLGIEGEGRLAVDPAGVPEGRIDLTLRNWRAMLDAAERTGAISGGYAATLRAGFELLAMLSGEEDVLTAPLIFSGGLVSLGPVPLGEAPRL